MTKKQVEIVNKTGLHARPSILVPCPIPSARIRTTDFAFTGTPFSLQIVILLSYFLASSSCRLGGKRIWRIKAVNVYGRKITGKSGI